jgi:hypothetical protein
MSRRALIAVVVLAFLAVSFELARYLSLPGSERNAVFNVLKAEAKGDTAAVLKRLDDCPSGSPCAALVAKYVPRLRHAGHVKILLLESKSAYTLGSKTAITRVAWTTLDPDGQTHVQCVTVHKHWSFLSGSSTSLRRISAPIGNEASC